MNNGANAMVQANVDFSDILSYASKLSKYTSAPPGFDQMSNDFKVDFEKPYPDEDRMRRGLLYRQYAGTHVLPNITDETGKVYKYTFGEWAIQKVYID